MLTIKTLILSLLFVFVQGFEIENECILIMVGKANGLEETEQPLMHLSDLEKLQNFEWTHLSCVSLILELKNMEFNLTQIINQVNAIPREKNYLRISSSNMEEIEIKADFKCSGYTIEMFGNDGKIVPVCSSSLRNIHINVCFYCFFPYCIPDYGFEDGTAPYLLNLIVNKLGLIADNIFVSKAYDTRRDDQGEIIGMVGDLVTGKADFGMGQPSLTWKRYQHIDFTSVISKHTFGFCSNKPTKLSALFAIIRPFQWSVWITLLLILVFIPALFYAQQRVHNKGTDFAFSNFSFTFRVLMWGSSDAHYNGTRDKLVLSWIILTSFWLGTGMLINMSYSSELLAEMAVLQETQPFDNVQQMLEADLQVFLLEGSIMGPLMRMSVRAKMRELYQKGVLDQNGVVKAGEWQNAEMREKLREGEAVRVCTPPHAILNYEHYSKEYIAAMASANILPKGSSFMGPINRVTNHALAAGLMQKKFDDLVNGKALITKKSAFLRGEKLANENDDWEPLSLHLFYGILLVWTIGLLLGLVSFISTEAMPQSCLRFTR